MAKVFHIKWSAISVNMTVSEKWLLCLIARLHSSAVISAMLAHHALIPQSDSVQPSPGLWYLPSTRYWEILGDIAWVFWDIMDAPWSRTQICCVVDIINLHCLCMLRISPNSNTFNPIYHHHCPPLKQPSPYIRYHQCRLLWPVESRQMPEASPRDPS